MLLIQNNKRAKVKSSCSKKALANKTDYLHKKLSCALQKYQFVECVSSSQIELCHTLRHQIFCSELHLLPEVSSQIEVDAYDNKAKHFLVFEISTQRAIATFRIIAGDALPAMQASSERISIPKNVCEISRFSILKPHRHSDLRVALIFYAAYIAVREGYSAFFIIIEHKFATVLKKYQFILSQITNTFEYMGKRAIYMAKNEQVSSLLDSISSADINMPSVPQLFGQQENSQRHWSSDAY